MTPLTAPLPLRTTAVWGSYAQLTPIPHRYGITTGAALQYDSARTQFVWADHASEGVDQVTVAGVPASEWQWNNGLDSTGHPVTLIRFSQPQDDGAEIVATGRGKLDPRTGAGMDTPAQIIWDVLANIAGLSVDESVLASFAAECHALGFIAAGSLDAADKVGSIIRSIADSFGALYAPDMPGLCRLWPAAAAWSSLTVDRRVTATAGCDAGDLVNDLTLRFDFADGTPRQTIQLEAPDSVSRRGRLAAVLDAPWIGSARVAFAVAARRLGVSARPQWRIALSGLRPPLTIGDFVDLNHPVVPVQGRHMITARESALASGTGSATVTAVASGDIAVRLVQQSAVFAAQPYVSGRVQTVGSERVLTLLEEDGTPIAQAAVTLDGTTTRYTDEAGRVSFPVSIMPVGPHELAIVTADGRPLALTVLVT